MAAAVAGGGSHGLLYLLHHHLLLFCVLLKFELHGISGMVSGSKKLEILLRNIDSFMKENR